MEMEEYIQHMRSVSSTNDWNKWIKFFLIAVENQAIRNLEVAESIKNLYEQTKVEFSDLLASKWNLEILDYIFKNPIFRNNKFMKGTGIPNATAVPIIKKLVEAEYLVLKEESSGRRAALYVFEPMMRWVRI